MLQVSRVALASAMLGLRSIAGQFLAQPQRKDRPGRREARTSVMKKEVRAALDTAADQIAEIVRRFMRHDREATAALGKER